MKYLLIVGLICFFQLSCNEEISNAKARDYYSNVHRSTHATKLIGQRFVDKLAIAMQQLQSDNNSVFDIKDLRLLLDSVKQSASLTLTNLKSLGEFDKEVDPDNVEVLYQNNLIELCNNEFAKMLEILDSKDKDRGKKIFQLKSAFEKFQAIGNACENVSIRISEKYHIASSDSLNN